MMEKPKKEKRKNEPSQCHPRQLRAPEKKNGLEILAQPSQYHPKLVVSSTRLPAPTKLCYYSLE